MRITRSNYESWFLDFLEGNLDPDLAGEFHLFLSENPDIAKELQTWELFTLATDKSICFDKDTLKKPVTDPEIEFKELAIAYHEGDLSVSERISFEAGLRDNPDRAVEAREFGRLKLMPEQAIVYPDKELLKKRRVILPLWIKVASVAAILLVGYLLFETATDLRPEYTQLADELKNTTPKRAAVPPVKLKEDEKSEVKSPSNAPVIPPARMPASQKKTPVEQKSEKRVIPTPKERAQEPEPLPLRPRGISFGLPVNAQLAEMKLNDPLQAHQDLELSELLKVQIAAMRKSDDREILSSEHLGLSGLQLFAKLTGKRLTARKGDDGAVHSVSYNSRILAFSIPVNR